VETKITDAENEDCQQLHDEMLSWLDVQDEYDVTLVNDAMILYFALKTICHPATESVRSVSQSILQLCTKPQPFPFDSMGIVGLMRLLD
jgi:hypothetical protein